MKMFITMYESFTNPYILLEKLQQRYQNTICHINIKIFIFYFYFRHNVPKTVDPSRVPALQLRVCVVLKYWIDNHGDEYANYYFYFFIIIIIIIIIIVLNKCFQV